MKKQSLGGGKLQAEGGYLSDRSMAESHLLCPVLLPYTTATWEMQSHPHSALSKMPTLSSSPTNPTLQILLLATET